MNKIITTTAVLDTNTNKLTAIFRCPYCNAEWKYMPEYDEGIGDIIAECNHQWHSISYNKNSKEVVIEFK